MKKTYEEPEVKLIEVPESDVICASGCQTECPEFGTGSILES